MKITPLISVIIPIYNAESFLEICLESVVNQTYKKLEIILVNDGSTDQSLNICKEYQKKDSRIKIIDKQNEGLVNARKTGVNIAQGDYVTYVDADDWIDIDTYEAALNVIERDVELIIYGLTEEYLDHSNVIYNFIEEGFYEKNDIIKHIYPVMLCNEAFFNFGILPNLVVKIVRRDILQRVQNRVTKDVSVGEDADCTFQLLLEVHSLKIIKMAPYHYRKRYDSMMSGNVTIAQCRYLYEDLKKAFISIDERQILIPQLNKYMLFLMLLKRFDIFLNHSNPFVNLRKKKIVIYGAGGFGQEVFKKAQSYLHLQVAGWVDKRHDLYSSLGLAVEAVDTLFEKDYDTIFIAILNERTCQEIKKSLVDMGISRNKIEFICVKDKEIKKIEQLLMEKF